MEFLRPSQRCVTLEVGSVDLATEVIEVEEVSSFDFNLSCDKLSDAWIAVRVYHKFWFGCSPVH